MKNSGSYCLGRGWIVRKKLEGSNTHNSLGRTTDYKEINKLSFTQIFGAISFRQHAALIYGFVCPFVTFRMLRMLRFVKKKILV